MDDSFINGNLERYRLFNWHQDMFHHFKRHFLNFWYMNNLLHWVRHGLLNGDGDFFDDGDHYGLRYGNLDRDWVRHRDDHWLIDFELYVLRQRDYNFFVVLDGFRVLFFHVLVYWVDVGLEVVSAEVVAAKVSAFMAATAASEVIPA